jgi:hypothetical protein
VRCGGILANSCKGDRRGSANFRDLYASRLISVAADCSGATAKICACSLNMKQYLDLLAA